MNDKLKGFVTACMEFFGRKDGQGLQDFANEVKKLTDEDKAEIYAGFQKLGIVCRPPGE